MEAIRAVTAEEVSVSAFADEKVYQLKLSDIYYFEIVDGYSFLYCEKSVFKCRQKLYEFEELCRNSMLFRCSKSMILNAGKIQYVRPSVSGQFEATLTNSEKVIISRHIQTPEWSETGRSLNGPTRCWRTFLYFAQSANIPA